GLSHPHDGYDSSLDIDYGPGDDFYFVWLGDESNTVMHYLALSNTFGVFDQDNMYRWEMAGYLNRSNELLGEILAHPGHDSVRNLIMRAGQWAGIAERAFDRWEYGDAVRAARNAYEVLARAADQLGIEPPHEASLMTAPIRAIEKDVDTIRDPQPWSPPD